MLTRATSRSRRLCLPWLSTCPSVPSYARCCVSRRAESGHVSASKRSYATYKWIEDVEPFERYVAGGYYPVRIGDEFCSSRYRIVHKLGYGASSTTWLARDEHLAKYVAIKFAVSSLETPSESAILKTLWDQKGSAGETHADIATIPEILDEFDVDGPEIQDTRRRHRCMVTIPARMSVSEAREASYDRLFQPLVARAIAAQLIQTVAFLHSRGIVHAGG
jgi:serine/threonine-protein kinase SRPK3